MRIFASAFVPAAALALAACALPARSDRVPGADLTFDELVRIDHGAFDRVWVRPGISLAGYDKVWLLYTGFAYKSPPRRGGGRGGYPLDEAQIERLETILREVFLGELARDDGWHVVEGPGPDVLLLRVSLIDVIVKAPPEPLSSDRVYIDSAGEATLVLEIHDSQSREVLVRAVDRSSAEPAGRTLMRNIAIQNEVEVRRVLRSWAGTLRRRLDAAKTLELPEAYGG